MVIPGNKGFTTLDSNEHRFNYFIVKFLSRQNIPRMALLVFHLEFREIGQRLKQEAQGL